MSRVILVTGAGRGLGYCVASRYAEMGDRVYAYDVKVTEELKALEQKYPNVLAAECDIASTESVQRATQAIQQEDRIDILYNIAGIFRFEDRVNLAETDLDLCSRMFEINAVGALRICKACRGLLKRGTLIMTVSSEAGSIGGCRRSQEYAYSMSKAAVNMAMKTLSNELYTSGVRVMLIHPGWMRTVMGGEGARKSPRSVSPEESAESIIGIADDIDNIPRDQMYMRQTREILPW